MRLVLITTALLAALALPAHARAADDDEDDSDVAAMIDMLSSDEGIPQANIEEDNGWMLSREKGGCSMFSFNDSLAISVDANKQSYLEIRFFDGGLEGNNGDQVELLLAFQGDGSTEIGGGKFPAVIRTDKGAPAYVIPVPIAEVAKTFPNGFQMALLDANEQPVLRSDARGTGKHLAALGECAKD
jgi:hypothetical protein